LYFVHTVTKVVNYFVRFRAPSANSRGGSTKSISRTISQLRVAGPSK
jgi:hypothetical protein